MKKMFWTLKRLEALSKSFLTIAQAFLIAGVVGGFFGKIQSNVLKTVFIIAITLFFLLGILFSDWPVKKES